LKSIDSSGYCGRIIGICHHRFPSIDLERLFAFLLTDQIFIELYVSAVCAQIPSVYLIDQFVRAVPPSATQLAAFDEMVNPSALPAQETPSVLHLVI
jgi:hypothetical protein